jgi:hypothetical protein
MADFKTLPSGERVVMPSPRSALHKPPKAMTSTETNQVRSARRQRRNYEAAVPERFEDATKLSPTGMSVGQVYHEMRWGDTGVGPRHYDEQLPGMADPNAAARPPRWHELSAGQQAHVHRALAMRGTSVDQMASDFGAQMDQGYMRAHSLGAKQPYAKQFYNRGSEERDTLDNSARDLGIPQPIHATMNAITSPNVKFKTAKGYPNDEAAVASVKWAQEGRDTDSITSANWRASAPERAGQGLTARPANLRKAVHVMKQVQQGTPLSEATGPTGLPVFGEQSPKTGPYANSWSDTHPQHFVADVHSGGGGMVPHLGSDKPAMVNKAGETRTDANGRPVRDKSEREKAIERVPYFHTVADEAARRAMVPRGVGSVREAQATQWGEEQIQRGPKHGKGIDKAYPLADRAHDSRRQIPGQGSLL